MPRTPGFAITERLFQQVLSELPKSDAVPGLEWPATEGSYACDLEEILEGQHSDAVPYVHWKSCWDHAERDGVEPFWGSMGHVGAGKREPSEQLRNWVEGGIRERGLEALAFYKSPRFKSSGPFPGMWGIFYLGQALEYIAWELGQSCPACRDPRETAYRFLRAHERLHFQADLQILMLEALLKRDLHGPLRRALRRCPSDFVEEALANKRAYEWAKRKKDGVLDYVYDFMSLQPGAYARFEEPRLALAGEWAANVLDLRPPRCAPRSDLAYWVEAAPTDLLKSGRCPEHVVVSAPVETWGMRIVLLPKVHEIVEEADVLKRLASKFSHLVPKWEDTKRKLIENCRLRGLNFKPWPKGGWGVYSVRVDRKVRAHLRDQGRGMWSVIRLGGHTEMGHG